MQSQQTERKQQPKSAKRLASTAALALTLFGMGTAQAQAEAAPDEGRSQEIAAGPSNAEISPKTSLMVEIDPMPFALSGHAVHVRVALASVPGLVISGGTYGMSFPNLFTGFNSENKDEGWDVQIDKAYATFADYHFSRKPEGLFVGTQIAYQGFEVERDQSAERRNFGVIIAMARVGTLWKPFDSGFYVLPWAGVYANIRTDDNDLQIGDQSFDVAPVAGFATLHLG